MQHFETVVTKYEIRNENEATIILPAATLSQAIEQVKTLEITDGLCEVLYPIIYTVNEKGMEYIAQFLLEKHKLGEKITSDKNMMNAWAREAEDAISNCGHPCFEIASFDTTTGHTEECRLDIEHFEVRIGENEIDYEHISITYHNSCDNWE